MKLQGLSEEERYSLLLEATLSLNVKKMKADADELKAMKSLKSVFAKGVGAKTWEEAIERYPTFTSEAALEPYVGMHKSWLRIMSIEENIEPQQDIQ